MSIIRPITVMIPTMNRPESLQRTITSILEGSSIPSQIIVVDQSVEEKDAQLNKEIVNSISLCQGCYYFQQKPSLTRARNNAIRFAKEEICICCDDDVDVYPNTIENVYQIMQDRKISMIAGIDDNQPSSFSKIGYLFGTKSYFHRKTGHVTLSMLGRYPDDISGRVKTEWAMGYFFVIRKSLAEQWKLRWDENLTSYAYAEDLDYSFTYYKNSKKNNLICIIDDKVRVKHLATKEYRIPTQKSTYMYVLNRVYLSYKHKMGIKSRFAIVWSDFGMLLFRIVKKNAPKDLLRAMYRSVIIRPELKRGIIKEKYYR